MDSGSIYIMTNSEIEHLVKIGFTTRDVKQRAKELSTGAGLPGRWVPAKSWFITDPSAYEKLVHRKLSKYRKGGPELYKMNLEDAINNVSVILRSHGAIDDNGLSDVAKKRAKYISDNKKLLSFIEEKKDLLMNNLENLEKEFKSIDYGINKLEEEKRTLSSEIEFHKDSKKFTPQHIFSIAIIIVAGSFFPLIFLVLIYIFWNSFIRDHDSILREKNKILRNVLSELYHLNKRREVLLKANKSKDDVLIEIKNLDLEHREISNKLELFL